MIHALEVFLFFTRPRLTGEQVMRVMFHHQLLHSAHLIILVSFANLSSLRPLVDLNKCYSTNVACFGVLNGVKSVGNAYGCIKSDNCNILLYAERKGDDDLRFAILSKWSSDTVETRSRFSISENSKAFESDPGYIDAVVNRTLAGVLWESRIFYKNEVKNPMRDPQFKDSYSVYDHFYDDLKSETLVLFKTNDDVYDMGELVYVDLAEAELYIHLELDINGRNIERTSTDYKLRLFRSKDINNPPIFIKSTTTSQLPEKKNTFTTFQPSSTVPPTDTTSSISARSTESKTTVSKSTVQTTLVTSKSSINSTFIVIIVFAIVLFLIVIIITGICLYNATSKKVKIVKNRKRRGESNQREVLERIRGGSPSEGNSPGL